MNTIHRVIAASGAAALLFGASAVQASPVLQNLQVTASDFSLLFGSASPLPASPLFIDFTVSFDNASNIAGTTVGLTVNSFNLPFAVEYAYAAFGDSLTLASDASPNGCNNPPNSFCMFIDDISSANPIVTFVQQSTQSGGYWSAQTISSNVPGTVPEPGALALVGLALMGVAASRRKRA